MTTSAYTLEQWISQFRNEANTVDAFTTKLAISDGSLAVILTDETVLSKYQNELNAYLVSVALTQREQDYYAYNPRLFSYDLYGQPEYWYLVLYANEMRSALEFHPTSKVRFYSKGVTTVINEIRLLEQSRLDDNEQDISDIVVNKQTCNDDINIDLFS